MTCERAFAAWRKLLDVSPAVSTVPSPLGIVGIVIVVRIVDTVATLLSQVLGSFTVCSLRQSVSSTSATRRRQQLEFHLSIGPCTTFYHLSASSNRHDGRFRAKNGSA